MKNEKNFAQVVREKKEMLDVLEQCMNLLERLDNETRLEWRPTGEQEQGTKWDKETGEVRPVYIDEQGDKTFENTGEPYYVDKYDDLPKITLSEQDEARINAIEMVKKTLASLA